MKDKEIIMIKKSSYSVRISIFKVIFEAEDRCWIEYDHSKRGHFVRKEELEKALQSEICYYLDSNNKLKVLDSIFMIDKEIEINSVFRWEH